MFHLLPSKMYFTYSCQPQLEPVEDTLAKDASWRSRIGHWMKASKRLWVFVQDWYYDLDGESYVIPKGFTFDGASVPKPLQAICNPMGILLYAAIIHDFGYRYSALLKANKEPSKTLTRSEVDLMFYKVNLELNQLRLLSYVTYLAVRCCGYFIWRNHRANESNLLETKNF